MRKHFKKYIFLIVIIIVAFALRFYQFNAIPEGFHADEAAFGYNAYSFLLTGTDEYGHRFPLSLRSFDDFKGAVYAYITVPFVALMGLTEAAVRLPSVIFGTGIVFITYLIIFQLTKEKSLSLLSAGISAISPIGILLSRVQSDPLVSVFFILMGLYCFLCWIENKKQILLFTAGFFWIISFFTYASPRIFLPFLLILLTIFYGKKLIKQKRLLFIAVFIFVFIIDVFLFVGSSKERFEQLSVFNTPVVMLPLEEQIREDGHTSAFTARIFHNKVIGYGEFFIKNYSDYFSFNFLFLRGGQPLRETIPGIGMLLLIELPFLLIGIYKIIEQRKRWGLFLFFWFLSVPALLAMAVDETPNVHRFFLSSLPLDFIVAYGLLEFYRSIKNHKKIFSIAMVIIPFIFLGNLIYLFHQLFIHQPNHLPHNRGFAYKALVAELTKQHPNYKQIVITKAHSSPYIHILFYNKYSPKKYQEQGSPRDLDYKQFDKYYFTPLDCPFNLRTDGEVSGKPGILYVNKGSCPLPEHNTKVVKEIFWRDNTRAFQLVEYIATGSAKLK